MDHPFEVGKTYHNRKGRYQVLSIDDPKMRVRYEDGREINLTIAIQAQILEGIQFQESQPKAASTKPRKGKKKRSQSAQLGYEFSGLKDTDFKSNVTGTNWRSRKSLGGRLAQQMSDTTLYTFQSHAIARRPSVYVTMPDYYDPQNGIPYAKQELRLFPDRAQYGFYIERADQSRTMDSTWHWRSFLTALETKAELQQQLLKAMQEHSLTWVIQLEEGEGKNYIDKGETTVQAGSPLLWNEIEEIEWPEFTNRLRAIPPDQWLNVHLCAWTDKLDGIAAGERFADLVSIVFRSVLPLYAACVGIS